MCARIVILAILMTWTSRGQKPSAQPTPIAWFSVKSSGSWVDESDPKHPHVLNPGDPIYLSSELVRRSPKSSTDVAYLSLPDASYQSFACSQPTVCDAPLDLVKVAQVAGPHLSLFQRVISTMSGRRRPAHSVLKDVVVEFGTSLPAAVLANAGTYSFAWCLNALYQTCPDDPVRVTVWDVGPGLHRLILLKREEDEWFYTEEDAYVLVIGGPGAKSRVAGITDALNTLQSEPENRARIVTLFAIEANP